jgi:hypothetical protein
VRDAGGTESGGDAKTRRRCEGRSCAKTPPQCEARRLLGGPTDPGRASYQVTITTCDHCARSFQHSQGRSSRARSSVGRVGSVRRTESLHSSDAVVGERDYVDGNDTLGESLWQRRLVRRRPARGCAPARHGGGEWRPRGRAVWNGEHRRRAGFVSFEPAACDAEHSACRSSPDLRARPWEMLRAGLSMRDLSGRASRRTALGRRQ